MRKLRASFVAEIVYSLCLDISFRLPDDVRRCVKNALNIEESERGRSVLRLILENASLAGEKGVPICQDTGIFSVMLFIGRDTCIFGDLQSEISQAVRCATADGALRASIVIDPLGERRNTGDNTPSSVICLNHAMEGTYLGVMAKGGGSEMASAVRVLPPSSGMEGVIDFIRDVVIEKGPSACPPLFLGIGVGGSFDESARLAKMALMLPFDRDEAPPPFFLDALGAERNESSRQREREILKAVNLTGIGPGGFGGSVTCLGVRVLEAPCHIANLPVALCLNCHALRRKIVQI